MSQGTPFRNVRAAALKPRQGTPFRNIREAALKPRQGTPFRSLRGAPVAVPPLVLDGLKVLVKIPGKPYFAESRGLVRLVSALIDTTIADQTALFLVPAGVTVVVIEATFTCTAAANVAAPATALVAAVSGGIFASQELLGLLAVDDLFRFPVGGLGGTLGPGSAVFVTIDAPATGASVSQTAQIELTGYLV